MQISKGVITATADLGIAANKELNESLQNQVYGALFTPDSIKLVDLEGLLPEPRRFRGRLSTTSIESFVDYCSHQGENVPTVFVDTEGKPLSANAIFKLGDHENPEHITHTAKLELVDTAEMKAVKQIINSVQSQSELHDWIEDHQYMLECIADDQELHISAVLAAVRNVTIDVKAWANHTEHDFGANRSAMDQIEAGSGAGKLPGFIVCTFVPHLGLSPIAVRLRVGLKTGGEKPAFQLRWVQQELQMQKIGEELQQIITDRLAENSDGIFMGTFNR